MSANDNGLGGSLERIGMNEFHAAEYLGISVLELRDGVAARQIPPPKSELGTPIFSRSDLDTVIISEVRTVGKVYVVGFDAYIKIGWTSHLEKRLSGINSGLPKAVQLHAWFVGSREDERAMHIWFNDCCADRGEWFRMEGRLADWVSCGCPKSVFDYARTLEGMAEAGSRLRCAA